MRLSLELVRLSWKKLFCHGVHGYDLIRLAEQGEVEVLLVTLKVRLHVVAKTVFAVTSKVFLLTFIYLTLSPSYWVCYIDNPINQI